MMHVFVRFQHFSEKKYRAMRLELVATFVEQQKWTLRFSSKFLVSGRDLACQHSN